jgi:hypothetical protein
MRRSTVIITTVGVCLLGAPAAFADVQLTMQDGRVSIVAKDATLRQIMTEWARVGQTKVVNVERIPGGPMTLQLTNIPEEQALAILMKPLSGYMAAPRANSAPNQSRFDRILVMPTIAAARQPTTATASATSTPAPVFQSASPGVLPPPQQAVEDDDDDRAAAANNPPAPRAPVFTTFPQPQVVNPNGPAAGGVYNPNGTPVVINPGAMQQQPPPQQGPAAATPSGVPTIPAGVAVPGMMVPVPQQPNTPGAPRRPGGAQD